MDKHAGWWDSLRAKFQALVGTRHTDRMAERHFKADQPDWSRFDENIERPRFRRAVLQDPRSDKKLRVYTSMQGRIKGHEGPSAKVMGSKGNQSYDVQYHKDIGRYTCTCNDFKYKQTFSGGDCKHIKHIRQAGGLKVATIRSFGSEYAKILDQDPFYQWAADSAQTRALRQERDRDWPDSSVVDGRLRTSGDEPPIPVMGSGRGSTGEDKGGDYFYGGADQDVPGPTSLTVATNVNER